jgi:uncharacterized protein YlzI (FlbEa/FlbD family)
MPLKKFEFIDGNGVVFLEADDVSSVKIDSMTEGVQIVMKNGDKFVVIGTVDEVAVAIGYTL